MFTHTSKIYHEEIKRVVSFLFLKHRLRAFVIHLMAVIAAPIPLLNYRGKIYVGKFYSLVHARNSKQTLTTLT